MQTQLKKGIYDIVVVTNKSLLSTYYINLTPSKFLFKHNNKRTYSN